MKLRLSLFLILAARPLLAQADDPPFPPHKVIGNLYYVGSTNLASFLITTERGHILVNSINVNPGYVLVNNAEYPRIVDDYRRAFEVLRALPCDVFLAPHGNQYGLAEKYAKLEKRSPNPFIDPKGYRAYLDNGEKLFLSKLEEQKRGTR